jgi:hypothetical protein
MKIEKSSILIKKNFNSNAYSGHRRNERVFLSTEQKSEFETERGHITEQSLSSL